MEPAELKDILDEHRAWLLNRGGRRADLRGAVLSRADLRGAVLSRADLSGAVLSRADLSGAVLSRADLRGAVLRGADLSDAVLRGADLSDADLSGADLSGAVLSRADLMDASGNRSEIKAVDCDTYCVTYTADRLQIGCQNHPIADWWAFDEGAIRSMDGERAVAWWARWKPLLQQIIETSPAKPTGHEAAAEPQAEAAE